MDIDVDVLLLDGLQTGREDGVHVLALCTFHGVVGGEVVVGNVEEVGDLGELVVPLLVVEGLEDINDDAVGGEEHQVHETCAVSTHEDIGFGHHEDLLLEDDLLKVDLLEGEIVLQRSTSSRRHTLISTNKLWISSMFTNTRPGFF